MRKIFLMVVLSVVFLGACSHEEPKPVTTPSMYGELPSAMTIDEGAVEMKTEKPSYSLSDEEITLIVDNLGPASLSFGLAYTVETRQQDKWYEIPLKDDIAFPEMGLVLKLGDTYQQKIDVKNFAYTFTKGEYRVIKRFYADEKEIILAAQFTME